MATVDPKSFLLGARYDWLTAESSAVTVDPNNGLSLVRTRPLEDEPAPAVPRNRPRYIIGRLRYDIDRGQREVRAYTLEGRLRHRWVSRDDSSNHIPSGDDRAWDPVDITGDDDYAFLLDERYQTVYRHSRGRETLSRFAESDDQETHWTRLVVDDSGCLLILDDRAPKDEDNATVYDRYGRKIGTRMVPWPPPPATLEPEQTTQSSATKSAVDDPAYETEGLWLSLSLDSSIYNCSWHRIEMTIESLPPGTQIGVKTFAYSRKSDAPTQVADGRLVSAHTVVAPTQPAPELRKKRQVEEFLVQNPPGQFLSVMVELIGDGFATPVIHGLRVHYPRESYLEYLPPLYSAQEQMRLFLERFLAIFQTEWDALEQRISEADAFFDPDAVPDEAMAHLAGLIGLKLEGSWRPDQNRKLLQAAPKIFRFRGTIESLRDYVRVYLANIAELTVDQVAQTSFPVFVEGFRERSFLMLANQRGASLGDAQPLWGASVVKRLQLGVFSRADEVELVSTGAPEQDLFDYFAHRFRVYAPAAWVRTAEHEQLLRRAIEAEMPAYASYSLCLVDAGVKVGIQSTVGLDMILGQTPACRLSRDPANEAPSLPDHNRLGYGAVLSGKTKGPAVLNRDARVGDWILN
jgi:phage tail-like protein